MDLIQKYFPGLTPAQIQKFNTLINLLPSLNAGVNVISRKDVGHLEERHILHSLSIAREHSLENASRVMDVGTGGGFPGIPLAILYPETQFILTDSIAKKIRLVKNLCEALKLDNAKPLHIRAEEVREKYNLAVTRAVAPMEKIYRWTHKNIIPGKGGIPGGIIALKGGDLEEELKAFSKQVSLTPISNHFEEAFFSTKMIVYLKI